MRVLFWMAAGTVLYTYVGYPVLLVCLRRFLERPIVQRPIEPFVSIVIPAHDEARVIASKIDNALDLDYPREKLEIIVASDGSTDGTGDAARACVAARPNAAGRVRVLDYDVNRGKTAVLNDGVTASRGEIVVFTDAAAMFASDAIRMLVRNFADPAVGVVAGVYKVSRPDTATTGTQEDFYWKYETFVKRQEAAIGSMLGAHGQIYAVRRALYPFPAARTINDDYVIPVRVLQAGHRVVYEPGAIVYEDAQEMSGFGRRVRVAAGNLQQLGEMRHFLSPLRPLHLWCFVSHKALRLAVPVAMVVALAANLLLAGRPGYGAMLSLQTVFYLLAAIGSIGPLRPKVLRLPYYFCMINGAICVAAYYALGRRQRVTWN